MKTVCILIIDDDSNFAHSIKEILENEDELNFKMRIITVRTLRGAVEFVTSKDFKPEETICILDLMFPPENGNVGNSVKALTPGISFFETHLIDIKTIIITGALRFTSAKETVENLRTLNKDLMVMTKPVDADQLVNQLTNMVER